MARLRDADEDRTPRERLELLEETHELQGKALARQRWWLRLLSWLRGR
jgi:hypothetical protein